MSDTKYTVKADTLIGIANALRTKTGTTGQIRLDQFKDKINNLTVPTGSVDIYK